MTSHDVVDVVRRAAGQRRVGHTGTLDPGAAGVLVVCLGRATRLSEFLMDADKEYRVELRLGVRTSTGDAYGEVLPAPDPPRARTPVGTRRALGRREVEDVLHRFTGTILQVPPMVSAIHHEGERLYRLARRGETVELQPREITVHRIDVLSADRDWTRIMLHVACAKGTYIRKLCADVGDALGTGGYAHFMVRTRAGAFHLDDALTLEELDAARSRGALPDLLVPMDRAVAHLPAVDLSDQGVSDVLHGHPIPVWKAGRPVDDDTPVRLRSRRGALIALARVNGGLLRPFKVLGGPAGGAERGGSGARRSGPR